MGFFHTAGRFGSPQLTGPFPYLILSVSLNVPGVTLSLAGYGFSQGSKVPLDLPFYFSLYFQWQRGSQEPPNNLGSSVHQFMSR